VFREATWRLAGDGLVHSPFDLAWRDFTALPTTKMTRDFVCVEGWRVPRVDWQGVSGAELIRLVKPKPEARYVVFHADEGVYSDCLSLAEFADPRAMLAFRMRGRPLPAEHGGPLRLVVPWMYGYKSVKWVRRLEFVHDPIDGYWEQRGYPREAPLGG
jgi:DMSO/TMAO reductase YedYZ molybdopterin-dependent catalytic subunit